MKKDDASSEDVKIVEALNYKQELKRSLKLFSSFAIGFSFISITTGIFTNFKFVIQTGGPAGIWSWPSGPGCGKGTSCIRLRLGTVGVAPLNDRFSSGGQAGPAPLLKT